MERKQVLLVGLGTQEALVREALKDTDIEILSADDGRMEETVGAVFTEPTPSGLARAMDLTLIMFRNFTREELDPVLKAIREAGLSRQPLKAMVTAHNWGWKLGDLYEELQQEQKVMGALIRLRAVRDATPMPDFMDIPAMRARMVAETLLRGGEDVTVEAVEKAIVELKKYQK